MGTSVSQRSPDTLNWTIVSSVYDSDSMPVERVAHEVWRAACNQPEGNLADDLKTPFVRTCFQVARNAPTVQEAISSVRRAAVAMQEASLATSIAQRAVTAAVLNNKDRSRDFVTTLFYEASNYLVSRDLPGHLGRSERTKNVAQLTKFKEQICSVASSATRTIEISKDVSSTARSWNNLVNGIVGRLQGVVG